MNTQTNFGLSRNTPSTVQKYTWLKQATKEELKAFIGLVFFRGLYSMNHHNIELLFKSGIDPDIFRVTMPQQRMRFFLLAHISFDDKNTSKDPWPSDRFVAAIHIFEMFNKNCSKYVIPSEYSVQTVQSKETSQIKYRLLLKSINDSRFSFTYKAAPYSGKPENGDGLYYTCAAEDYVKYLVNEVEKDTSLKGCNISTDRLHTSVPPAKWLLDRNVTTVGTLNTVRIGIPDELKDTKCRENFGVSFHIKSKEKKAIYNNLFSENKIHWTQECPYAVSNESNSRKNQR